jgi:hypothetical protein
MSTIHLLGIDGEEDTYSLKTHGIVTSAQHGNCCRDLHKVWGKGSIHLLID